MRLLFTIIVLSFFVRTYSQVKHKSISDLGARLDRYASQHKTDSAFICISDFLQKPGIDTVEMFYGHLFFGQAYFQAKKISEGFAEMKACEALAAANPVYLKYRSKLALTVSEEYFTLQQYDSASVQASRALGILQQLKPVDLYDQARCYNILGYCAYLDEKYPEAIAGFEKSVSNYKATDNTCEIPLVYCKMAKVYNRTGNKSMAEKMIREAIMISDSCDLEENILVCKYAQLEIYKENHEYEKALACLEGINVMVEILDNGRQIDKIDELQIQYKMKFKDYENNSLKQINLKNEEVLWEQKLALIISITAILLLSVLSFLVVRISRQRKSALLEIALKNRKIEKQNSELERLHLLNQKIFSVISHDFRGPMLSLQLLLDAFEKESRDSRLNKYAQDVSNQLTYVNQILDNLLNWARTEINIQISDTTTANPHSIAQEIINQFKAATEKKSIVIVNSISPSLTLQIPPDVLRIVFRNLLSNAIKYSFENSDVKIFDDPLTDTITVKDHGTGIDESKLNRLFSKDIESSLGTWQEAGFGLGLYIIYELLHRFGGNISASGHKFGGTEFAIQIPVAKINGKP